MFKYVKFTKVEAVDTVLEFRGGDDSVKVNYFSDNDALAVSAVSIESDAEANIDALITSQPIEIGCTIVTQAEFSTIIAPSAQIQRIKQIVEDEYIKRVSVLTSQYPVIERETWATQLEQAKAFKISAVDTDAPFLKILADAESDTVANFADAVIAKASEYEIFMAIELATKRQHESTLIGAIGL